MTGEDEVLDAAIDQYERAGDLRADGDDVGAMSIVQAALERIEELFSVEAGVVRARFAITRAEIATRTHSVEQAIVFANDAVERARRVRRTEPALEASALYMRGKAERPSEAHRFGATSFEQSLTAWRKLERPPGRYTCDAAGAVGTAFMKLAEWQHAANALDIVIENDPDGADLVHVLHRAIATERLGQTEKAHTDLKRWRAGAVERSVDEQVRGHLCASRVFAALGDAAGSAAELAFARELAQGLPEDSARSAMLLESTAWAFATAAAPWLLASEVLIRRAAALAWSPAIADTATRIAMMWRYGVEEVFVQPTFAVIEIEACLQRWDTATWTYVERPGHQELGLCVAGAPTTLERLVDDNFRELCCQRVFSAFHAEQFKANEPSFVAPVKSKVTVLAPQHVLGLLPSLRIPKWATTNTVALSSLGEVEIVSAADFAMLAARMVGDNTDAALALVADAVPSLGKDAARALLGTPGASTLAPSSSIPLIPGS